MTDSRKILGVRLAEARAAAGMTQEQVGALIGRSRTTVTNVEGGKSGVDALLLAEWVAFLGVTPNDVLPGYGGIDPRAAFDRIMAGEGTDADRVAVLIASRKPTGVDRNPQEAP